MPIVEALLIKGGIFLFKKALAKHLLVGVGKIFVTGTIKAGGASGIGSAITASAMAAGKAAATVTVMAGGYALTEAII